MKCGFLLPGGRVLLVSCFRWVIRRRFARWSGWPDDQTCCRAIAAENNLSETAFYIPNGKNYCLRWFTPGVEVDLCGHATLASAHVIFSIRREIDSSRVSFETKSGELTVEREGDLYVARLPGPAAFAMLLSMQGVADSAGGESRS